MLFAGTGRRWSAGVRQGVEPVQGIGNHVGPGSVLGEAEVAAAAGGDKPGGGGEQPKPQSTGLPPAGLVGQSEQGHPGQQIKGDLDDLQSDLVLCGVVEEEVTQAGGAGGAHAVFGPGPLPVA